MAEWVVEMGTFLLQTTLIMGAVGLLLIIVMRSKETGEHGLKLHVESLNDQRRARQRRLRVTTTVQGARKKLIKAFRQEEKARQKAAKQGHSGSSSQQNVWVLDFHGDIKASQAERFAQEVSAVIDVASGDDEVIVRLESAGGLVHAYGLAAAQLDRLREAGLTTTVCIDKVAASGGYMMACTASHIKAAPFAVIGSIGVVAQVPNIHRLLKRNDIDVELLTAGKYKRTLTVLGENTEEGREKFIDDLENTHRLFKEYVSRHRPEMDIDTLATGEIWYGSEALEQKLVDSIGTSEAYLVERIANAQVYRVKLEPPKTLSRKVGLAVSAGVEHAIVKVLGVVDAAGWQRR
ncbi:MULTISPECIES: protease SohB [unclassified Halomonas]|uniref:protease SohB n=1 Tax=unclassified Halomonas TaxID=2609666 RepID=UPI001EF4BCD0|nr:MULTISPECIES: protease SohB [unclassified Halomonas]MCG7578519.1 protease SohB [Halomonas sp. MMH1-48]MCG7605624.1 protease SohB [Halomonas sp. MM17-34]MCG7614829.1 protease SohB [Halomonas sp. MM17-29]MCG7621690.1 protease SohB [Halomonas sp. DSH1-27]